MTVYAMCVIFGLVPGPSLPLWKALVGFGLLLAVTMTFPSAKSKNEPEKIREFIFEFAILYLALIVVSSVLRFY